MTSRHLAASSKVQLLAEDQSLDSVFEFLSFSVRVSDDCAGRPRLNLKLLGLDGLIVLIAKENPVASDVTALCIAEGLEQEVVAKHLKVLGASWL